MNLSGPLTVKKLHCTVFSVNILRLFTPSKLKYFPRWPRFKFAYLAKGVKTPQM